MIVTLKGDVKDALSSRAGIYVLGPNKINGKSHWLQDLGTNAIWHDKVNGNWNIGSLNGLGGTGAWITTQQDGAGPQEATTWKYFNDKWTTSDDIFVDTFVEPGTY